LDSAIRWLFDDVFSFKIELVAFEKLAPISAATLQVSLNICFAYARNDVLDLAYGKGQFLWGRDGVMAHCNV